MSLDKSPQSSCKWFPVCPMKFYTEMGELDPKWIEQYCLVGNRDCIRYQKEERGEMHPDNLLPDGSIQSDLA